MSEPLKRTGTDPDQFEETIPQDDPELVSYKLKITEIQKRHGIMFSKYGHMLEPNDVELGRAQLLLEVMLPAGSRERLKFESMFADILLQQIEANMNRLMAAERQIIKPAKGLFLPKNDGNPSN